jgi:tetratricopeptide (TPR) repeat protein
MAPELLDRASVRADVRSEVYSLGVLLYELLALKSPFEGGSVESVRARILASEVEPLEKRHRGIAWELGAIVACAMERDPARRYVDVTAFVADLRRAMAHEPIEARRAGFGRRAWRRMQRHPVASTAAALTMALVVAVPLTYAFQQTRLAAQEAREAQRVRDALAVSDRERIRAEQSELDLLDGIDRFFVQVGAIGLENIPGTDSARARLMAEAQSLLARIETRTGGRIEVAREVAKARVRQGELLVRFGRLEEAEAATRAGLELCERFLVDRGDEVELLRHASLAEAVQATIARLRDQSALAGAAAERSLRFLERAAVLAPANAVVAEQRAIRLQDLALAKALEGTFDESIELFEQSESAYERLLELAPAHPLEAFRLVGRTNHAAALANLARFDEARRMGELALEDLAVALEEAPEDGEVQNSAATLWRILRGIAQATQDAALEDRAVAEAAALARAAFERFPERDLFRIEMVESHADWGALRWARGSHEEALALLERAYEASLGLHRTQVQRLDALFAICKAAQHLAIRSNESGRPARSAEVAATALPFALELLRHEPTRRAGALRLALERAKGLALTSGPAEAVAALRELTEPLALRRADLRENLLPRELWDAQEFREFRAALAE